MAQLRLQCIRGAIVHEKQRLRASEEPEIAAPHIAKVSVAHAGKHRFAREHALQDRPPVPIKFHDHVSDRGASRIDVT
jgi:hypothetical protein